MMTIEDIKDLQADDERYEAIGKVVVEILNTTKHTVKENGGNEELFADIVCHKEVPTILMESLLEAMPSDYGVKTK